MVYSLAILFVAVLILAEIVNASRSRSVRTLYNRYTLACLASFLIFILRQTVIQINQETHFFLYLFDFIIMDYVSLILLNIYFWFRGGPLVAAMIGKRDSYETRCPEAERKKMCWFCIWTLGVYFIILRAGSIFVVWLIDVFGN